MSVFDYSTKNDSTTKKSDHNFLAKIVVNNWNDLIELTSPQSKELKCFFLSKQHKVKT